MCGRSDVNRVVFILTFLCQGGISRLSPGKLDASLWSPGPFLCLPLCIDQLIECPRLWDHQGGLLVGQLSHDLWNKRVFRKGLTQVLLGANSIFSLSLPLKNPFVTDISKHVKKVERLPCSHHSASSITDLLISFLLTSPNLLERLEYFVKVNPRHHVISPVSSIHISNWMTLIFFSYNITVLSHLPKLAFPYCNLTSSKRSDFLHFFFQRGIENCFVRIGIQTRFSHWIFCYIFSVSFILERSHCFFSTPAIYWRNWVIYTRRVVHIVNLADGFLVAGRGGCLPCSPAAWSPVSWALDPGVWWLQSPCSRHECAVVMPRGLSVSVTSEVM